MNPASSVRFIQNKNEYQLSLHEPEGDRLFSITDDGDQRLGSGDIFVLYEGSEIARAVDFADFTGFMAERGLNLQEGYGISLLGAWQKLESGYFESKHAESLALGNQVTDIDLWSRIWRHIEDTGLKTALAPEVLAEYKLNVAKAYIGKFEALRETWKAHAFAGDASSWSFTSNAYYTIEDYSELGPLPEDVSWVAGQLIRDLRALYRIALLVDAGNELKVTFDLQNPAGYFENILEAALKARPTTFNGLGEGYLFSALSDDLTWLELEQGFALMGTAPLFTWETGFSSVRNVAEKTLTKMNDRVTAKEKGYFRGDGFENVNSEFSLEASHLRLLVANVSMLGFQEDDILTRLDGIEAAAAKINTFSLAPLGWQTPGDRNLDLAPMAGASLGAKAMGPYGGGELTVSGGYGMGEMDEGWNPYDEIVVGAQVFGSLDLLGDHAVPGLSAGGKLSVGNWMYNGSALAGYRFDSPLAEGFPFVGVEGKGWIPALPLLIPAYVRVTGNPFQNGADVPNYMSIEGGLGIGF